MSFATPVQLLYTDDEYLIDWSPRRAGTIMWMLFALAWCARLALNRLVPAPFIFNDEQRYLELARSVIGPHGLYWNGAPADFPSWIYPLLISPFVRMWPFGHALWGIQILNTTLINLAIPITFWWAREVVSQRRAVLAALFVALLPSMGYSAVVMTESAFLPAMTLALWLLWRQAVRPSSGRALLAGLASGLALHVKPQALLLPLIFAPLAILAEILRAHRAHQVALSAPSPTPAASKSNFVQNIFTHTWVFIGFALALLPRLAVIHWIEHPNQPLQPGYIMGLYTGMGFSHPTFTPRTYVSHFILQSAACFVCCGIFPAWALGLESWRAVRGRIAFERQLLAALGVIAALGMVLLCVRLMLSMDEHGIPYERYLFVIFPPLLILFSNHAAPRINRAWHPLLSASALLPALVIEFFVHNNFNIPTNDPALCPSFLLSHGAPLGGLPGYVCLALLAAACLCALLPRRTSIPLYLSLCLLFASGNLAWYGVQQHTLKRGNRTALALGRTVDKLTGPHTLLYVVPDYLPFSEYFIVAAMHHASFLSWRAGALPWIDLHIAPTGGWQVPPQPLNPWVFASKRFPLLGLAGKKVGNGLLYKLTPNQQIHFSTQSLLREILKPPTIPVALFVVTLPHFHAGQTTELLLRIHSTSKRTLDIETLPIRIGYHWEPPHSPSSPSPLGAIADGNHFITIPPLEPHSFVNLPLLIKAPPASGKNWQLKLQPYYVGFDGRPIWKQADQPVAQTQFPIEVTP